MHFIKQIIGGVRAACFRTRYIMRIAPLGEFIASINP
jgi:hypothetical protein